MDVKTAFDQIYYDDSIPEAIVDPKWYENGKPCEGYFGGVVKCKLGMASGGMLKFREHQPEEPYPLNRRGLIVGTPLGNVVVFERYKNCADELFQSNAPESVRDMLGLGGPVVEYQLLILFGYFDGGDGKLYKRKDNIGTVLYRMLVETIR